MTIRMNTNLEWLKNQAETEGNGIVSVGGLFVRSGIIQPDAAMNTTERLALARLVKLQRRALGLHLDALAEKAGVELDEIVQIESGDWDFIEPRIIHQLSAALRLPGKHLMQLSGLVTKRSTKVHEAAMRFAAKSEPVTKLTREEHDALEEFVKQLAKD